MSERLSQNWYLQWTRNDPKFRHDGEPEIGASGNVVICLPREIPRDQNYKLYFDRYYTSLDLALYLFSQGIQCVGTNSTQ